MHMMAMRRAASIVSGEFWKAYWITMRPYLLYVSGAAGLAGISFSGRAEWPRIIAAFIPLFFSYGFGQALTDCFQIDTDSISSSYRPLCRGTVTKSQVAAVSLAGLIVTALVLAWLNPITLILGVCSVIGLATYTPFKRTWWGGPPWNSWIVMLLPLMGCLACSGFTVGQVLSASNSHPLLLCMAVVFFGYANFVVIGYFKDISADRLTHYRTFPVVFGWTATAIYSDLLAVAAACSTAALIHSVGTPAFYPVVILAAAMSVNLAGQMRIHSTRDEQAAHLPITHIVRAFILYCEAITVCLQPDWLAGCAAFYLLFEITLRVRPERSQV
jgi:4-hydroxybenzoate polyprenyltransferase